MKPFIANNMYATMIGLLYTPLLVSCLELFHVKVLRDFSYKTVIKVGCLNFSQPFSHYISILPI